MSGCFTDLFSIPKYALQLVKTLHPEMQDVGEDDIKTMNHQNNDLGLLVRDRLMIFMEAQSSSQLNNNLIILFLYLAAAYQEYIEEKNLCVFSSQRLPIPKPEFYIIYTGGHEADTISIRKDIWGDEAVPFDLEAKVIHTEDEKTIIGQYITFCHVLNDQIERHGRTAISEAIRFCIDRNILKEYLESRGKDAQIHEMLEENEAIYPLESVV